MNEELENLIRKLPLRKPSQRLDQRVLAALADQPPESRPTRTRRIRRIAPRWSLAGLGAAAAILLLIGLLPGFLRDRMAMPFVTGPKPAVQFAISTLDIYSKETDPCNILPPMPDWR